MLINGNGQVWVGRRSPRWLAQGAPPIWQMPQGGLNAREAPEAAAIRELEEEIGYRAAKLEKLSEFYVSPGFLTEKMHLFLATELTETATWSVAVQPSFLKRSRARRSASR